MDPLVVWLTGALAAMGTAFMWLLRLYLTHLDADLARLYKAADRGTSLAERGAAAVEQRVS